MLSLDGPASGINLPQVVYCCYYNIVYTKILEVVFLVSGNKERVGEVAV
jgi:hypothetical protein